MTPTEERAQFLTLSPFASERDLQGFEQASPDEQAAIVMGLRRSGAAITPDAWDAALSFAKTTVSLLGLVMPLASAVETVYALAHL